jgi:hypothetical protein
LGACINGYTSTNIGYYSWTLAKYYCRPLLTARQSSSVLLLAQPPESWHGDAENARLADELIATYRPKVCVLANPRGWPGAQRLASTWIINPGSLADGRAAWLDWNRCGDDQVEFLAVGAATGPCDPSERPAGAAAVAAEVRRPA